MTVDDDHCLAVFDTYKRVIECADVVLIACASKFHPMYSEAAIRAGKHVFVEKPHAIDPVGVRRAQAVCDLAKEKGLSIVSGLQSRYHAGWQLCRTQKNCYNNSSDIIMSTKGTCHLGRCRIEGETNWQFEGTHNNPYDAEQKALIDSVRDGKPINSGYHMANSTMIGVLGQITCYSGKETTWEEAYNSNLEYGPAPEKASFDIQPPTLPDESGNYPLPLPGITKLI